MNEFLKKEARKANSTYKKLAVQWLNEALSFVSSSMLTDSFVLRNSSTLPHLKPLWCIPRIKKIRLISIANVLKNEGEK